MAKYVVLTVQSPDGDGDIDLDYKDANKFSNSGGHLTLYRHEDGVIDESIAMVAAGHWKRVEVVE